MSQPTRDSGFTLIELLVVISLMGAMMAIAVSGWSAWNRASEHKAAAYDLQTVLRHAQQRAITEGTSMCVPLETGATSSYRVERGPCGASSPATVYGPVDLPHRVEISEPAFKKPSVDGTQTSLQFSSRGSGWPGTLLVKRTESSTTYQLRVEVLTGHVEITQE